MKKNEIFELSFEFALMIIDLYRFLSENKEFILSKQILKSGTSIGANVNEAQAAQSKKEFIAKMSVASKKARETQYWLRLLTSTGFLDNYSDRKIITDKIQSIVNILTKIVKTSQSGLNTQHPASKI